ncbi:O-antigen ligase family protein [candidate division WWE3 bacterium]|uniref:O-antigen ligase family protein n=1 Tax=candidate division WWE3 bacterium TaxID=2053526 RepID=A0A955LKH6_UNCKA|nr:O-antigen ligase family protein [candidate division WWE3 bacterium]
MQKMLRIIFYAALISITLGQLGKLPIPGIEGGIYLCDALLGMLFVGWFIWRLAKKSFRIELVDLSILFLLFALFTSLLIALSWVNASGFIVGLFYWVRIALYLSLFRITRDLFPDLARPTLTRTIIITGLLFVIFGIIQFLLFPNFASLAAQGWDPHYYRVLSTFFDPNYAGMFYVLYLLFLLHLFYTEGKAPTKTILSVIIAITGVTLLLTFSRSTYLALAVGVTVFSLFKDRRIVVAMIIIGVIAFLSVPRVRTRVIGALTIDATAKARIENYEQSFEIIKDNPIFGVGFNTLRYAKEEYGLFRDERGVSSEGGHSGAGADNALLFVLATGGIVSLFSLSVMLIVITIKSYMSVNRALLLSVTLAYLAHTQFVNSLFYTSILALYLILIGIYLVPDGVLKTSKPQE